MEISIYVIPGLEKRRPFDQVNVENLVCKALDIDPAEMQLRKKCRKREWVEARDIVFYILVRSCKWKTARTGMVYGKDHATVLHALKTIDNLLETDKEFRKKVSGLIEF